MKKYTHVGLIVTTVLAISALVLIGVTLCRNVPTEIQTSYYSFTCPQRIEVQTREFSDYAASTLWESNTQVGGVDYYPSFPGKAFYNQELENPDFDAEAFLQAGGVLQPEESLDAYMLEGRVKNQTMDLWERRDGVERMHFFFVDSDHCYDLWFYCDGLSDSVISSIQNTFQLEVSV